VKNTLSQNSPTLNEWDFEIFCSYLTADRLSPFKGESGKRAETPPFKAGSDNFTHSKVSESEPDMV
jgi:hypothetical protein